MALKRLDRAAGGPSEQTTGDAIRVAKVDIGTTLKGYVVKLVPKEDNPEQSNFTMKMLDTGELKMIFTAGNLGYGAGVDGLLKEGLYTEITRVEDYSGVSKQGKKFTRTQFEFAQDDERTLADALFEEIATPTASAGEKPLAASKPAAAAPATGVRARTQEIARQVAAKR